jgi:hypothetical protein
VVVEDEAGALREVERAGRSGAHDAGDLHAGHEGRLQPRLVEPARHQQVGERHAGRVHVDEDAAVLRGLGHLGREEGVGAVERLHLERAHAAA